MAEARAFRSSGWPITLLGLVCCAAEADVLGGGALAAPGAIEWPDAATSADAGTNAGDASADDAAKEMWWREPTYVQDAGAVPHWTVCDPETIFERGRTGDACAFSNQAGCSELLEDCKQRLAVCVDGVLHLGQVSKNECAPDDADNPRRCAAIETQDCCVDLWQCEEGAFELALGDPRVRVCAVTCQTEPLVPDAEPPLSGCPNEPTTAPWRPAIGAPCSASFVCDSYGTASGPDNEFRLDEYGLVYWCYGGVLQRVAVGSHWPWSVVRLP